MVVPAGAIGLPTTGADRHRGIVRGCVGHAALRRSASTARSRPTSRRSITTAPEDQAARSTCPTAWNCKVLMFGGGGLQRQHPQRRRQRPGRPDRSALPARARLRDVRERFRPSGRRARLATRARSAERRSAEQLFRRRAEENARRRGRHRQSPLRVSGPARAYFAGGSSGGREALAAVQRWPQDWDGAIALYPAWNQLSRSSAGSA